MIPRIAIPYIRLIAGNGGVLVMRLSLIAGISHALPDQEAANFLYLYSTAMVLALVSDFGMRSWIFIEVGRSGGITLEMAERLFHCRRLFGTITFILTSMWALIYFSSDGFGAVELVSATLFGLFAATTPAADLSMQILIGQGRAMREAVARATEFFAVAVLLGLAVLSGLDARLMIGCWVLAAMLRGAWARRAAFPERRPRRLLPSPAVAVSVARGNIAGWLLVLINTLGMRYVILLGPLVLEARDFLLLTLGLMTVQVGQVVSSSIAFQVFGSGPHVRYSRTHDRLVAACLGLGSAMGAGFWLLRELADIVLDARFAAAPAATAIVAVCFPLLIVNDYLKYVFVQGNNMRHIIFAILIIAVVGSMFMLALGPEYGLLGVLGIYIAGQIAQFLFSMIVLPRTLPRSL
jgi:hypothetical protein